MFSREEKSGEHRRGKATERPKVEGCGVISGRGRGATELSSACCVIVGHLLRRTAT
jgi:hypothetical protein